MSASIARLFVDRDEICTAFDAMIGGSSDKQIMLIQADGGMGKSWLISKFKHECSRQSSPIPYATIDFKDGQLHDFLSIVRTTRDELGAQYFNQLTQVINEVTRYHVNVSVGLSNPSAVTSGMRDVIDSEVNVAGGHVIKDNFFSFQAPSESLRADVEARISKAFIQNLQAFLANHRIVFFFDTYEKATKATLNWIENRFLHEVREGTLSNALVIIAGRIIPTVDITWKHCTVRPQLKALASHDVRTYLHDKLGLGPQEVDADTLFRASQGNPQLLGMLTDNVLATFSHDDDW